MPDTTPAPPATWSKPVVRKLSTGASSEVGVYPGSVERTANNLFGPAS